MATEEGPEPAACRADTTVQDPAGNEDTFSTPEQKSRLAWDVGEANSAADTPETVAETLRSSLSNARVCAEDGDVSCADPLLDATCAAMKPIVTARTTRTAPAMAARK